MGRGPRLRPPPSGAPSIRRACPLSDSPRNATFSIHLMRAFIVEPVRESASEPDPQIIPANADGLVEEPAAALQCSCSGGQVEERKLGNFRGVLGGSRYHLESRALERV